MIHPVYPYRHSSLVYLFYCKLLHPKRLKLCIYLCTGNTLCWGNNVNISYRFYEHGLHLGNAGSGKKRCHLENDGTEIMLKSHYALFNGNGRKANWDRAQFGFLMSGIIQAPCKRVAIWVR